MAFLRYSVLEDNVLLRCWVMHVTWRLHVGLSRHRPPDTGGLWEDSQTQAPRAAWNPVRHWASCWKWASPPNLRSITSHHSKWSSGPHFLPRPGPLFSQRHLPNSWHYYYTQGTPLLDQRAGKKPGGASEEQRGRGKGKRRGPRRHAARSFAKPHEHLPHPLSPIQPPRVPQQVHPGTHRWTSRWTTQSEAKRGSQDCSWSHPSLPLSPGSQFCRSARLPSQNPRSSPASRQLLPGPPPLRWLPGRPLRRQAPPRLPLGGSSTGSGRGAPATSLTHLPAFL